MVRRLHRLRLAEMLITARRRLPPRTGAWFWRHKASRQRHKKRWRNFAVFIGDPFTVLCGDKRLGRRKRRILRKVFLLCCWNAGISAPCAKRKGGCVLICSRR